VLTALYISNYINLYKLRFVLQFFIAWQFVHLELLAANLFILFIAF